ncbi:MAG: 50S ribosomal protein L29 [Deltaproteobacteria bacterium]|nr:50S ribosomal protein L29 [Deltaproteobacteria bacterium]
MKVKEIRALDIAELKKKEVTLAEELFRLRIRKSTSQIEKVSEIGRIRKDIARIKTILREKEVTRG